MLPLVVGTAIDGVTTALETASTDVKDTLVAVLPYALGVFALTWGVRKAIRFFKGASN
jgi:hypothetical protein